MARSNKAKFRKANKNSFTGTKPSHFSMQEEARNTEGRNLWRLNTQLRHQAVHFIRAGSLEPTQETTPRHAPEVTPQSEATYTAENAAPSMTEDTSQPQLCRITAKEKTTTTIHEGSPGRLRSRTPEDSSEDEIVFRGRRSKSTLVEHAGLQKVTIGEQLQGIHNEGPLNHMALSADVSPDRASSHAPGGHSPGWFPFDDTGLTSPGEQVDEGDNDDDAILADYIAHMDDPAKSDSSCNDGQPLENDVKDGNSPDYPVHYDKNESTDTDDHEPAWTEELEDLAHVLSDSPKPARAKPYGNIFASATAFADALEDDPYYGLDVMDFSRSSLKKKKKGKNQRPEFEGIDSELENELINAWDNDRLKKKLKKKEREELRVQGLLGRRKHGPDLKTKYVNGIGIEDLKHELRLFLLSPKNSLSLPPMTKHRRILIHDMAHALCLSSQSRGKGSSRFPILSKTSRTPKYTQRTISRIDRVFSKETISSRASKGWDRTSGQSAKVKSGHKNVSYMDGDVVGASAPEIGIENKGRAMLEKMGWSTGTALGATNNKGILLPVAHVVKNSKAGLG